MIVIQPPLHLHSTNEDPWCVFIVGELNDEIAFHSICFLLLVPALLQKKKYTYHFLSLKLYLVAEMTIRASETSEATKNTKLQTNSVIMVLSPMSQLNSILHCFYR